MSNREKLIELIDRVLQCLPWGEVSTHTSKDIADHLISNGVTVGVEAKPLKQYLTQIDEYAGLKLKFLVFKADTGERIENCFVLRPDKDRAAVEALSAYAEATDNKTLADDIYNWVGNGVTVKKWIPVSDETRKPKDRRNYFIAYVFGNSTITFFGEAKYHADGDNGYVQGAHFSNEGVDGMRVTHWMEIPPLPEPQKECE